MDELTLDDINALRLDLIAARQKASSPLEALAEFVLRFLDRDLEKRGARLAAEMATQEQSAEAKT